MNTARLLSRSRYSALRYEVCLCV